MAKIIVVLKAILTRIIFGSHGLLAIWRVTAIKKDPYYWYLTASVFALGFEGIFTLTIKKNQEWKWFCPSVFFYLCSVVPAIWLIEVDKFDKKLALQYKADEVAAAGAVNLTAINAEIPGLDTFGVDLKIPVQIDAEMWVTVIEQFLMLILIIGRWMLPKGGLTRDQLSQLLLVYIGTAADIIEFFDSFKDEKISRHRILCLLILSIWSWSLLQFTFVLTATKGRRTRVTTEVKETPKVRIINGIIKAKEVCCNIDVWAILINIILQDAPFLIFRALLILYYKIISYMNIFFTAKNSLVIILQFYRLYVVQQEKNKELSKMEKAMVSQKVATAVERAARIGPQNPNDGRVRLVKNSSSSKRSGPSSKQVKNKNKNRSQDSISSQNTARSHSSRRERERNGRRRSLSTGNLAEVGEGETFEERIYEDDLELGMSGSALSGTNDPDSQDDEEESEVPVDEVSLASERPRGGRKNIRMSENPGIYKISGSRSSGGSSERGHGRYRQDTGYSSSSKDSGNSGGRRGGGGRANNNGGRSGRSVSNNRSRNSAQRRRQFISSKYTGSIEIGEFGNVIIPMHDSAQEESLLENERLWQRRVAIGAVFFLFVVIFIFCMVAIYGGINPKGLVLRENFRIRKTTRPTTTTTPEPSTTTEVGLTTMSQTVLLVLLAGASGTGSPSPPTPTSFSNTTSLTVLNNDTLLEDSSSKISFNESVEQNNTSTPSISNANKDTVVDDIITETTDDSNDIEEDNSNTSIVSSSLSEDADDNNNMQTSTGRKWTSGTSTETEKPPSVLDMPWRREKLKISRSSKSGEGADLTQSYHNLRHRFSRIFKFVSASSITDDRISPFMRVSRMW